VVVHALSWRAAGAALALGHVRKKASFHHKYPAAFFMNIGSDDDSE